MRRIEDRITDTPTSDCHSGRIIWSPVKSLWWTSMTLLWLVFGSLYFSWGAVLAFLIVTATTIIGGHSLGMHRKLIHDSFECPKWLERLGIWLGTLVGLGGPYTMMYTHDLRDWAQRKDQCHAYLRHGSPVLKDYWHQIHCKLVLDNPPNYEFPEKLTQDSILNFIQRTAFLQQIPIAAVLFALGGWGFVVWGVGARVSISIFGHWLVGWFAHNQGHAEWIIDGAAVQGHNVKFCGIITAGECWHNNHHAFPESAKIGLNADQPDPGWWVLKVLEKLGLVSNLVLPTNLPRRKELRHMP